MWKIVVSSFLLLCGCAATQAQIHLPEVPSAVHSALEATVGLVGVGGHLPYCSGVIHDDVVFTANHCVDDETSIRVGYFVDWRDDGFMHTYPYKVIHTDAINDFAVLSPSSSPNPHAPGRPLSLDGITWGQRAVAIGHPLNRFGYTITEGVVSHPRRENASGRVWMQISAPVTYGNSGGPVLNRWGEIIGITSFLVVDRRDGLPDVNHNMAGVVHLETLREYVRTK